jgi:hypothetical protein
MSLLIRTEPMASMDGLVSGQKRQHTHPASQPAKAKQKQRQSVERVRTDPHYAVRPVAWALGGKSENLKPTLVDGRTTRWYRGSG